MQNVFSSKSSLLKKININPKRIKKYKTSSDSVCQIKELQKTIGNQEVARLIESGKIENVLSGNIEAEAEKFTEKTEKIEDIQKVENIEEKEQSTINEEVEETIQKINEAIDIAYSKGLINTGNFLYHFLENNGRTLDINIDTMLENIKGFKEELSNIIEEAKQNALDTINKNESTEGLDFELTGEERKFKFSKSDNEDYFNILSKFNYTYKTRVITFSSSKIPDFIENSGIPEPDLETIKSKGSDKLAFIRLSIDLNDRFDKYLNNSIILGSLEIRNEDLEKLIKSDMAKEFDIKGKSSDSYIIWEYDTPLEDVPEEDKDKIEEVEVKEEINEVKKDIEEVKVDIKEVENPTENES